jgi:hypothetical protein
MMCKAGRRIQERGSRDFAPRPRDRISTPRGTRVWRWTQHIARGLFGSGSGSRAVNRVCFTEVLAELQSWRGGIVTRGWLRRRVCVALFLSLYSFFSLTRFVRA